MYSCALPKINKKDITSKPYTPLNPARWYMSLSIQCKTCYNFLQVYRNTYIVIIPQADTGLHKTEGEGHMSNVNNNGIL